MAKKYLKKNNRKEEKKYNNISFSLTEKETKKYFQWLENYTNSMKIDKDEDPFLLPVKFQFSPFELGVEIKAKVFNEEILLRGAWEDDEV